LLAWLLLVAGGLATAPVDAANDITGLRTSAENGRSRLVFDVDGPVSHQVFSLDDPERLVIDIKEVALKADLPSALPRSNLIKRVRSAPRNGNDLRVVLDLERDARAKSFVLRPEADYGHRLVVDVVKRGAAGAAPEGVNDEQPAEQAPAEPQDRVIAIDAGHGGRDPGASAHGTREKDIVLSVARRLNTLLEQTPGLRPVMTRNSDIYLPLRERIRRARKAKADLFVSIHADAFRDPDAEGSSVYALSTDGASSEAARRLAQRENSSDRVGGVSLQDKDEMVASVLLDLSQDATIEFSLKAGEYVLDELGEVNNLHKHSVQQAGFVVLKSPDIPSLLVETAFISNPQEARKLRSANHQYRLAKALRDGIRQYFENRAPRGSRSYAQNETASE